MTLAGRPLVLAFDTATEQVAVGLSAGPGEPVVVHDFPAPRAALGRLLPSVTGLLGDLGVDVRDVAAVVVGRGPGSFTGVRIGVATAKGLAHGLGVPLLGVGTLEAVARRFTAREGLLGIVGDAMRREVYPLLVRVRAGRLEPLHGHTVAKPDDVAEEWAALGEPVLLAGNGLVKYRDAFESRLGERALVTAPAEWTPSGAGLLAEAWATMRAPLEAALRREPTPEDLGDPGVLLPVYTRLSDAEENERRRGGELPPAGVAGAGEAT